MAQSYDNVVAVQIEAITPLLTDFFDMEMGLFERFEKIQSKSQSGRNLRMPIELRPGGRMRAINLDGGSVGSGSGPVYDYQEMSPVDSSFNLAWTLKSKFTTDSDDKAVVDTVQRTLASGIESAKIHVDKHLQTTGTGILATVTAYSYSSSGSPTSTKMATITCNNARGVRLLRVGDPVTVYQANQSSTKRVISNDAGSTDGVVINIDYPGKIVYLDAEVSSCVSGDLICVGGLTAEPPTWIYGLPYYHNNANSGTLLRWNRANYPEARTPTYAAGGANLTIEAIHTVLANLDGELGESVTDTGKWGWYMNPVSHRQLIQLMTAISEIELGGASKGGNPAVDLAFSRKNQRTLSGFEVITSINADPTRVDFIDFKNWVRGVYKELGFQKFGGSTVVPVPNSTSLRHDRNVCAFVVTAIRDEEFSERGVHLESRLHVRS